MSGLTCLKAGAASRLRRQLCGRTVQIVALLCLAQASLSAAFIGDYDLSKFTLTNINADGYAQSLFGGDVVILNGGNNGSGLAGTTTLTITTNLGGIVSFVYAYSSWDEPTFDLGGYLLNGNFTALADTNGQGGVVQFPVVAGDVFGFRVDTEDNTYEPGVLSISQFSAPGSTMTPEPATFWMPVFALCAAYAIRRRQN